ncbi:hypothetical protein [Reyranella sp.]|uniref:hypothetical protein n=1 Tax=Reyranella sp. TaxID=1929291 RepID=UPI003D0B23BE
MLLRRRFLYAPDGEGAGAGGGAGAGNGAADSGNGTAAGTGGGAGTGAGAGGGETGSVAAWRAAIAPEYAEVHQVKTAKDLNDIIKWGVNAEKMVGADKLVLPAKDAKPEERDAALGAIWDRLGRPKDAAGYSFPEVKDRPYTEADKALQSEFAPIAHKLGLTQEQVAGIAEFQTGLAMAGIKAATEGYAKAEADLRKEWGNDFDAKSANANKALAMVLTASGIPVAEFTTMKLADGTFVGDNPRMVKLFAAMGEAISETGFTGGSGGGGSGFGAFTSPAAAKAELDKLYAKDFTDPKHPYNDRSSPQHKHWQDRVMKLTAKSTEPPK